MIKTEKEIVKFGEKEAIVIRVVGDKYRFDINGVTVETMINGLSSAKRKAKTYLKEILKNA